MKIKEYIVVGSRSDDNYGTIGKEGFSEKINKMISEGWQPFGGLSNDNGSRPEAFQSMVKYEEDDSYSYIQSLKRLLDIDYKDLIKSDFKQRKIVDCFSVDLVCPNNVYYAEKKALDLKEGWETIYKSDSELKMVKYE